jgi:RNA polymerase sigma-70 factor (TIGR02943 family)
MTSHTTESKHSLEPKNWLHNYGDYLFSFAKLRLRSRDLAEDLVQETFLSALKGIHNYKGEAHEKTWLTAILKNKIIDHYRKNSSAIAQESYLNETEAEFDRPFYEAQGASQGWMKPEAYFKDWAQLPDQQLESQQLQQSIDHCLGKLPSKLAPVFISKYLDDKNADEICNEFQISSSNYWVIIHRAKILLRTCLEKNLIHIN